MNQWELYVYSKPQKECDLKNTDVIYTKSWETAKAGLNMGKTVIYTPYLSDLGYECPSLSMKNIYWNGLMGPTWARNLGMIINNGCDLFKDFPTDFTGGWQWEDILNHARGFYLPGVEPVVRMIDDWNRNLPLSLITMANVDKGRLLLVSADLEGEFENRPAAYSLKNGLFKYAVAVSQKGVWEVQNLTFEQIEQSMFPVLRMEQLCVAESTMADAMVSTMVSANPNSSWKMEVESLPVKITIEFKKKINVKGILYVPEQRERRRDCYPKECEIVEAGENIIFRNNSRSQKYEFASPILTDKLTLVISSTYGSWTDDIWKENGRGYYIGKNDGNVNIGIAAIHAICDEEAPHSDILFWNGEHMSTTKEIDA
jgi:hypothetical protein